MSDRHLKDEKIQGGPNPTPEQELLQEMANALVYISRQFSSFDRGIELIHAKMEDIERGNIDPEIRENRYLIRLVLPYTGWDSYVARIDDYVRLLPDSPDDCKGNLVWAIAALTANNDKPNYPSAIKWSTQAFDLADDDKQKWHCLYVRYLAKWRIGSIVSLWSACSDINEMKKTNPDKDDLYIKWKKEVRSSMISRIWHQVVSSITTFNKIIVPILLLILAFLAGDWASPFFE